MRPKFCPSISEWIDAIVEFPFAHASLLCAWRSHVAICEPLQRQKLEVSVICASSTKISLSLRPNRQPRQE